MQEWEEKVYERAEGKSGEIRIIRRKLEQGMTVDEIAQWMEVEKDYIEKIKNLCGENPEWNDVQIAAELL